MLENASDFDEARRENLTQRMRDARERSVVALQKYNTFRSKFPGKVIFCFEGDEDPVYYRATISIIDFSLEWVPLVCAGKDAVLRLREHLARNVDEDASNSYYFIDHDFDGSKGYPIGGNLYCTPSYSFENLLVTDAVIREVLTGEFKCDIVSDDIDRVTEVISARLHEFFVEMRLSNRIIHFCRLKKIKTGNIDNSIKKYLKIGLDNVERRTDDAGVVKLVGVGEAFDIEDLDETHAAFGLLDPRLDWRGKFIFAFFIELLAQLKEDRTTASPTFFSCKKSINFDPRNAVVRTLASIAGPPVQLREFLLRVGLVSAST